MTEPGSGLFTNDIDRILKKDRLIMLAEIGYYEVTFSELEANKQHVRTDFFEGKMKSLKDHITNFDKYVIRLNLGSLTN